MAAHVRDRAPSGALAPSETTLRALLENTTDSIFMVDAGLRLVAANTVFVRDFRSAYGVDLEAGMDALDRIPPPVAAVWRELFARALRGEPVTTPFEEKVDGESRHFEVQLNPVREGERVVGVTVVSRDVTAR